MQHGFIALTLGWLMLLPADRALSQEQSDPAAVFLASEVLPLRIEAPYATLLASRGENAEAFPATLYFADGRGDEHAIALKVETRGNFRNRERVCRFPPLLLDLPRTELAGTPFDGENRLKLVTHCQPYMRFRQYVLLEYLAYRMLNVLTDLSLRVRLLDLQYVDSVSGDTVAAAPGFLIESVDSLARRLALSEVRLRRIRREWYDPELLTQVALFQYLLGSVDWSALVGAEGERCCHNIEPLQDARGNLVPLAYDFDMSGLVNPSYGSVPRHLGIRRLTQRLYRGGCPDPELLAATVARFQARRNALYQLFDELPALAASARRRSEQFIDAFYAVIEDSESLQSEVLDACR